MRPVRLCLHACVLFASSLSIAQTYTPQNITFTGASEYKTADLTTASGLAPGKPVTKDEIQQAMQRLMDTGLFASLHYNVDSRALTFALVPQPESAMLKAGYTNFVFFQSDEITSLIHAKVPLFTGKVPNDGSLLQSVQDALAAILLEKGVHAKVESVLGNRGGVLTMNFSITDPPVQVRRLTVEGVSPAAKARVDEIRDVYASNDYSNETDVSVRERLGDAYRDLAFLDVVVDPTTRSAPAIEPTRIGVDVVTTVHEGSRYTLTSFEWPQSSIVPASELAQAAQIKPGEPASRVLLLSTTARVGAQFQRRGYLEAKVSATDDKNETAHTIGYRYAVEPGPQYLFKSVVTDGFSPQQQKDFDKNWKLQPGMPFDAGYVNDFFRLNHSVSSFQGYNPKVGIKADRTQHLVQVTYTMSR